MKIKNHIPNFITCLNLISGCLGIIEVFNGRIQNGAYLIFLACIFDFLDGFVARMLKVSSAIGKELDSLADMVTFGLLPGLIMYKLIDISFSDDLQVAIQDSTSMDIAYNYPLAYIALIIPVFSALRLAKFNIDVRQSENFYGLPTPANAIFIASLPLILLNTPLLEDNYWYINILTNTYILAGLSVVLSFLLVSEIRLFALKFKSFAWEGNTIRYIFLILSAILLLAITFKAIPIIIILYITLSLFENSKTKK